MSARPGLATVKMLYTDPRSGGREPLVIFVPTDGSSEQDEVYVLVEAVEIAAWWAERLTSGTKGKMMVSSIMVSHTSMED